MDPRSPRALGDGGADGGFWHSGGPAHLEAAKTVAAETWGHLTIHARLYRLIEFVANFCLPFILMWVVWDAWVFIGVVLLWYIPAAIRTRSPVFSPILLFTADDFSLLQMHPQPRSAWIIHIVAVARVFVSLVAFAVFGRWSPWSDIFQETFAAKHFRTVLRESIHDAILMVAWSVFVFVLASITVLWLCITIGMLVSTQCATKLRIAKSLRGEIDHQLLNNVRSLTEKIHKLSSVRDPSVCKLGLKELRRTHPKLSILGFVGAWTPLFFCILHIGLDVGNTITFAMTPYEGPGSLGPFMAGILGLTIIITLVMMCIKTHGRLWDVVREARLTQRRGLYTPEYLDIIRIDKGVQSILALAVKIYQLPYSAITPFQIAVGLTSIVLKIISTSGFVYEEFDLGTEIAGHHADPCPEKQAIVGHHRSSPTQQERYPPYASTSSEHVHLPPTRPAQHDQYPSYGSMSTMLETAGATVQSSAEYGTMSPTTSARAASIDLGLERPGSATQQWAKGREPTERGAAAVERRCRFCDVAFFGDAMFCPECGRQLHGAEYFLTAEHASAPPSSESMNVMRNPAFAPAPMPFEVSFGKAGSISMGVPSHSGSFQGSVDQSALFHGRTVSFAGSGGVNFR